MEMPQYDPNTKPEFELYTIPSHSSWFRWDDIHETERTALKEFFDGSSISRTPKIYKEYRDFMINKYREEPSRRLTFTQVRKSLVGDVSLLHKVFRFLDEWGLINFGAVSRGDDSDNRDSSLGDTELKNQVKIEEGAPNGVRVVALPNSLKPISVPNSGADGSGNGKVAVAGETGVKLPPLASYSDVFGDLVKLKGFKCGSCGEQCNSGCYEYSKQGSFVICEKCFKNGNYGEDKSKDDFRFSDLGGNSLTHGATWTEAETLLLLESVMRHGDNWELVAQNVPTKSKLDCISKLIELPFGEFMMGSAHEMNSCPTGSLNSLKEGQSASSENQNDVKMEDQVHDQMNESKQNGDAATEEPPAKRKRIAPLSDGGSTLIKQVGGLDSVLDNLEHYQTFLLMDCSDASFEVAHISTMVGPHVTAAAAEAAVAALCNESSCPREIFDGDEDYLANGLSSPTMVSDPERALQVDASKMEENQSETQDASSEKNDVPLNLRIRTATATALGAAAANAKLLADQEDREIEHLVAIIIETQMKKLHSKINYFDDLELIMEKEYNEMMQLKECLVEERIDVLERALKTGVSKWRS
ncbi:SWI/SNF complex subunit SWI3A [Citrus sinensis]|uniref:SWI/SNF complex subunit SWI3A n=1 Tax=Citrus sinensis TaxID=2711 RepID=A0ACB8L992_CITSI|nr:SWI/SNF complex subunit SWI3A [Citrus sinensis]